MKKIDSLLSPICEAIKETNSKSKQAVFNMYLSNILEAKSYYTWEQITYYINNKTKTELAQKTYINMTERAKKRQKCTGQKDLKKSTNMIEKKIDEYNKQRGGVKGFFSTISENKNEIDHDPSATNEKFINKYL